MMDLILAGLTWDCCLVYLDDVIVYGTTFQQHSERLATVLQRIKNANLKLHAKKCRLFQRETIFLGHRVTPQGTSPDPEKIRAVQAWPRPRNLTVGWGEKINYLGTTCKSCSMTPENKIQNFKIFVVNLGTYF
jgi:hypothetical protein